MGLSYCDGTDDGSPYVNHCGPFSLSMFCIHMCIRTRILILFGYFRQYV